MSNKDDYRPRLAKYSNKSEVKKWKSIVELVRDKGTDQILTQLGHKEIVDFAEKTGAKVLIYDIETAPLLGYVWSIWKQNISPTKQLVSDWFMLTWSAKWLFDDKMMSEKLTPEEAISQDDERITKVIWELLNEADIVIAHNGIGFDNKRVNTRFLMHDLKLPLPYQTIDTLLHARKKFSLTSNRLDYIGQKLGLGRKIDTGGFELWEKCMQGDPQALQDMETYNIQDVRLLEDVYLKLRPYIQPHPNMGIFVEDNVVACPSCGSSNLKWEGQYITSVNAYDSFRCNSCGSIGRSRKTNIPQKQKSNIVAPTAR